jgi:hypothetical protein
MQLSVHRPMLVMLPILVLVVLAVALVLLHAFRSSPLPAFFHLAYLL